MQLNYLKASIALCALVCITVLLVTHSIASDTGMPIITMIVGYAIGNGIAARQGGDGYQPLIGRKGQANATDHEA